MTSSIPESAYDHLATKADVEGVRADVERLRSEVERLRAGFARWMLRLGVAIVSAIGVAAGIVLAIVRLT